MSLIPSCRKPLQADPSLSVFKSTHRALHLAWLGLFMPEVQSFLAAAYPMARTPMTLEVALPLARASARSSALSSARVLKEVRTSMATRVLSIYRSIYVQYLSICFCIYLYTYHIHILILLASRPRSKDRPSPSFPLLAGHPMLRLFSLEPVAMNRASCIHGVVEEPGCFRSFGGVHFVDVPRIKP